VRNLTVLLLVLTIAAAAQAGPTGDRCDRDGDGWVKDSARCDAAGYLGIDCDDNDPAVQACTDPSGGGEFTAVDIEAGYAGSATEVESPYQGPYTGGDHHPWTTEDGTFYYDSWEANTLASVPRPCRVGATTAGLTEGRYDCFEPGANSGDSWPHGGRLSIDLTAMSWRPADSNRAWKNPEFCTLLNDGSANFGDDFSAGYLRLGVTRYWIMFMDGCVPGNCPISIGTNSYSGTAPTQGDVLLHPFHGSEDYPDVGRIKLTGWVDEQDVQFPSPNDNELNVFTLPQDLRVTGFTISFESVKNGALLATCTTDDEAGASTVDGIHFVTFPYPDLPQ